MLSLNQSAKRVGKGKTTLHRDIKAGVLSAQRDQKGRYKIDPAELARVYPEEYSSQSKRDEQNGIPERSVSFHENGSEQPGTSQKRSVEHSGTQQNAADHSTSEAMALVRTMIASVETAKADEIRRLEETIEDLRERLDKESAQNRALTQMITDQRSRSPEKEKKGFLGFLRA